MAYAEPLSVSTSFLTHLKPVAGLNAAKNFAGLSGRTVHMLIYKVLL
ncbi:hypothetical protein EYZ11_013557 [Aspergillus tanneri]|uniref:Uncharacterized protein n=1 Tax=Aspergillus tanneri TaxID=1220188 RepID=A0A4S3IZL1_9EURO|nr:hypothetical protein EYZ11_013557 [Aspergillus tanneri]